MLHVSVIARSDAKALGKKVLLYSGSLLYGEEKSFR